MNKIFVDRNQNHATDAIYRVECHDTYYDSVFGSVRRPTLTIIVVHERCDMMSELEVQAYWRKAERIAKHYKEILFGWRKVRLNWLMRSPHVDEIQPSLGQSIKVPYEIMRSL